MTNDDFVVDKFEHAGLTVKIVGEQYIDELYDPREADMLGQMFCYHPNYDLGDEQLPRDGFAEIECPVCEYGERDIIGPPALDSQPILGMTLVDPVCPRCEGLGLVEPTVQEWLSEQDAIGALPLFLLDHSGITMNAGRWITAENISREDTRSAGRFIGDEAGWDTSFVGFIIVTAERVRELCGRYPYKPDGFEGTHEEWLAEQLEHEVEEYAKYLEGDAGGFIVEDEDGEHLESCWGFLGLRDEHVREEAKWAAEYARDAIEREKSERELWAARDVITTN